MAHRRRKPPRRSGPKAAAKTPAPAEQRARTLAVEKAAHGFRRKMVGKVIKDKMNKTVVVECVSARRDPLYGSTSAARTRYKAHDETNQYKVGDRVEIQEHRPISRDKRWHRGAPRRRSSVEE